ncbi:MAG: alpha,alpha-trehalose-phosphate synthase (UDP-forming), partial [Bdellovibrionota bacterium]
VRRKFQYYAHEIAEGDGATLVLAQDLSSLRTRWIETFIRSFLIAVLGGVFLLALITSQMRVWMSGQVRLMHQGLRSLIAGKKPDLTAIQAEMPDEELKPISKDLDRLAARILSMPRKPALAGDSSWLATIREEMQGRSLTVIANREPYIHEKSATGIRIVRPASGLVTALEPVLRKSGGLWIAHGSGSADHEVVNEHAEVEVPPGNPSYTLRRVWLTKEEEEGYYYGFSNEGLWPLCHLAHTRPTFRLGDWRHYQTVNQRFCESVPSEQLGPNSLILVQDYHYALLPRMIRERAAAAGESVGPKIGIFWHIPWPNPEAFGICPWNKELLRGMLGADVIGFHTQYHCNNFLDSCNRYLEARIDLEHFTVTMDGHVTQVRAFPIGIDTAPVRFLEDAEREELKIRYGLKAEFVAVGVDRLDYTKGLIERVEAVERFLEKHPDYIGRFTLAQMGSPSRSHIPAYQALADQLERTVERVNLRFAAESPEGYLPIRFLPSHHQWEDIQYFYQLGDICMVTSLHDGMNLVAKEYVWCQRPDRGALILSKFTGASRELSEALIVNPYSIEEMADAIAAAVMMPAEEKARRMIAMRARVESRTAYHWASDQIRALVRKSESDDVLLRAPDPEGKPSSTEQVSA